MTVKLYDTLPYETEFEATVTECISEEKGFRITLDQTLFFPNEGGQDCDKGSINGLEVKNVEIVKDDIYHYLDKPLESGTKVKGQIEWKHRFENMQCHSGEHIFSGLAFKLYGITNVGFHLSTTTVTLDTDKKLTEADLSKLETMVNERILRNLSIKTGYPSKEELSKLNYRSKKELEGPVRIVEIEDTDMCACCAPHVARTGEIGLFKIIKAENYKQGMRINFLCGYRALRYFDNCLKTLDCIGETVNAPADFLVPAIIRLMDEKASLKYSLVEARRNAIAIKVRANATLDLIKLDNEEVSAFIFFLDKEDTDNLRFTSDLIMKSGADVRLLFAGDDETGYRYLIESEKYGLTELNNELKNKFGAKGGGKPNSIQGTVICKMEEIRRFLL